MLFVKRLRQAERFQSILFKVLGACLLTFGILRIFAMHAYPLEDMLALYSPEFGNNASPFLMVMVQLTTWATIGGVIVTSLYPFFKNVRGFKYFITYFALPVACLNLIFFYWIVIALVNHTALDHFSLKILFYFFEQLLFVTLTAVFVARDRAFKMDWKMALWLVAGIIGIMIYGMPSYMYQALLGQGPRGNLSGFSGAHRVSLYLLAVVPICLYLILRKKDAEQKRLICLIASLCAMFIFSIHRVSFARLIQPGGAPLHICNTAMFILPLCFAFKMKRLFYFTLFINVLGAFLALFMPSDGDVFLFQRGQMSFYQNHVFAFYAPLVAVALGVFPRPRLKQFLYSMGFFTIYFVFIVFINCWLTNYNPEIDYFYVNNDFITSKLGRGAQDARLSNVYTLVTKSGLKFVLYPLYWAVFYMVYIAAGFAMWFLYEQCYQVSDNWHKLVWDYRNMRKGDKEYRILKEQIKNDKKEEKEMLRIIKFSKRYGNSKTYAVSDFTLEIKAGEVFGFLGPNGAGKSTIIKSIVGIQPIADGKIEIFGHDVEHEPVAAKQITGFVPDHYTLYEKLTGREYVNYIADLYGVSKAERNERIEMYTDKFEMKHAIDSPIKTYSHGMKQKVTIMAALVHNPKLWILDEPLTGLDPNSIFNVKEAMREHAKAGNIVFFSSHIVDVVERICDRIAIIKKGQICAVTSIAELGKRNIRLEDFYISFVGNKGAER